MSVGTERVAKIVGYQIKKGDFKESSPNLPQRIAILAEANEANQATLDLNPKEITSAQQAGLLYGFGSPIHQAMRILRPVSGDGVGGIPTVVYPQAKAAGAIAKVIEITPTGTATKNGTHIVKIAGREGIDGIFYQINIETGDTAAAIAGKIIIAVSKVLSSPVNPTAGTGKAILTAKWNGLTSNDLNASVVTGDEDLGITYAVTSPTAGSGTPSGIEYSLAFFGQNWNTILVNGYGTDSSVLNQLNVFNGRPNPENPSGRYSGIIMKPFIALCGSVIDNPTTVTDPMLNDVTIAICPAPGSKGMPIEAAANMAVLFARTSQDTPHLDVSGQHYPDMPTPLSIGSMSDYNTRDEFVKKGCSTVVLNAERFQVQDFVTTYHPVGETPPQFRYCRNLMIDFNIRYGYYLQELINVVDHAIARNSDIVQAAKVVKPKQWVQILGKYAQDLASRALIVDAGFMQDSVTVNLSTVNPDRLETFFRYKRSGYARISSTVAEAGFNFGTLN